MDEVLPDLRGARECGRSSRPGRRAVLCASACCRVERRGAADRSGGRKIPRRYEHCSLDFVLRRGFFRRYGVFEGSTTGVRGSFVESYPLDTGGTGLLLTGVDWGGKRRTWRWGSCRRWWRERGATGLFLRLSGAAEAGAETATTRRCRRRSWRFCSRCSRRRCWCLMSWGASKPTGLGFGIRWRTF